MAPLYPAARMAFNLAALAGILWALAYWLAGSPAILQLYRPAIGTLPAHLYAERLAELAAAGGEAVALVGPSTVREGFDTGEMERAAPGLRFFNCGVTSQGSMQHTEMLLDVMARFGLRPRVLVLGLNSRMLSRRDNLLGRTGFADLLDYADALELLPLEPAPLRAETLATMRADLLWPLDRFAQRLDTLFRFGLLQAHTRAFGADARTESQFRRGGDSLVRPPRYLYAEREHSPQAMQEQLEGTRRRGLFDRDAYAQVEQIHSLHRVLTKALGRSERVYVVVMPEHSAIVDQFGSFGDYAFDKTLAVYRGRGVEVLDHRRSVPDRLIRDMAHLVADGRALLSRQVAIELTATAPDREDTQP